MSRRSWKDWVRENEQEILQKMQTRNRERQQALMPRAENAESHTRTAKQGRGRDRCD